jgi:hypothetical protein
MDNKKKTVNDKKKYFSPNSGARVAKSWRVPQVGQNTLGQATCHAKRFKSNSICFCV